MDTDTIYITFNIILLIFNQPTNRTIGGFVVQFHITWIKDIICVRVYGVHAHQIIVFAIIFRYLLKIESKHGCSNATVNDIAILSAAPATAPATITKNKNKKTFMLHSKSSSHHVC